MKLINLNRKLLIICMLHSCQSFAFLENTINTNNIGSIYITGPADKVEYGSVIKNSGSSRNNSICNNSDLNYTLSRIEYQPISQWTGQTYQASSANPIIYLFETGVSGLSFAPMGGLTYNAPNDFKPLPSEKTIVWKGSLSNNSRITSPIKVTTGVYIYKGPERIIGNMVLPTTKMYRYACYDQTGTLQEITNVQYNSIQLYGTVSSCSPTDKIVTLSMDKIPASKIENADTLTNIATKKQTFSLLCDPNIEVFTSIIDLTDITNKTAIANLTPDSSASGIGFAVTGSSGQRLQFGPDGSAANIPGQIKYYIQRSGTALKNNPISYTLGFSYVRKPEEEFKTGSAKAMIGITYSYQ